MFRARIISARRYYILCSVASEQGGSRWLLCIVGGPESLDVDALQLAQTCEKLGAGEIFLNCIDRNGTNSGFDIELVRHISEGVSIPVIASSGAGKVEHFSEVFKKTDVEAALAAGLP